METSTTLIISDAHLGAAPPENERALHDFLAHAPTVSLDLVINGDLFDFWFEYGTVVLKRHFVTLRLLAELVEAGVRVRHLSGNHDSWGGAFLRDEIGIELIEGPVETLVGGRRTYLAHGDGIGGGDWAYRVARTVIRSRIARAAFRQLHPDRGARIVRAVSRTEARRGGIRDAGGMRAADRLAVAAERILAARPDLELVAFGHCHLPELREIEPGRHYLNTGDWVHHCTWAEVSPGGVKLSRWRGGARREAGPNAQARTQKPTGSV